MTASPRANSETGPALLKPILVLGSGRTGSTALMSLLGGSPKIGFDKTYPYESTYLSYLAQVSAVVGGPLPKRAGPDAPRISLVTGSTKSIGALPFKTRDFLTRAQLSQTCFLGMWSGFSRLLIDKAAAEGAEPPTHYAEKAGYFALDFMSDELETRQIFLMRDPRDIMISSKRFNEKRGILRFGWLPDDTDASYARRFANRIRKRMVGAIAVEDGEADRVLVRYEDLVLDQVGTARRLSEFLGVELRVEDQLSANEAHKTSSDPAASVGRWREEMDDQVKAIFDKRLGDVLERAGYGRANASP